ncbi:MAG: sulfatase [Acidobacteria bacterium]|nr:sulfatase [Acidobacteriota bacterium]
MNRAPGPPRLPRRAALARCALGGALGGLLAGIALGAGLAFAGGGVVTSAAQRLALVALAAAVHLAFGALVGLAPGLLALALAPLRRPAACGALAALAAAAVALYIGWRHLPIVLPPGAAVAAQLAAAALAGASAAAIARRPAFHAGRALAALVLPAVLVLAAGLALAPPREEFRPGMAPPAPAAAATAAPARPAAPRPRPRNVVLVLVDALRADHLSCYGYPRPTSPHIDALAERGVLFEQAIAQKPKTSPSVASILTGTYPYRHGILGSRSRLPDASVTLAERLSAAGLRTAAVVANPNLFREFGFDQGFATYVEVGTRERGDDAAAVNREVFAWLDRNGGAPFFLFVHYIDPHLPYAAPPPFRDRFRGEPLTAGLAGRRVPLGDGRPGTIAREHAAGGPVDLGLYVDRYDGEVAFADAEVGRLLARLRARGDEERTLFLLGSDHGESLVDHEVYLDHGQVAYDAAVRVPLVVSWPEKLPVGRVGRVAELVDIAPTVLELFGLAAGGLDGASLVAALLGTGARARDTAFVEVGSDPEALAFAVRTSSWKLIHDPRLLRPASDALRPHVLLNVGRVRRLWQAAHGGPGPDQRWELYDLHDDPGELANVVDLQPEVFAQLRDALAAWLARAPLPRRETRVKDDELRPGVAERLRSLGYGS